MVRRPITIDPGEFPLEFRGLLQGTRIYDSSSSRAAKVYFIEKDGGYFLKCAPVGSLAREAALTRCFHSKGLGARVLSYGSGERDWLLTERVPGEDCIHPEYLSQPEKLAEILGRTLRMLHSQSCRDCPIPNRTADYLALAERNHNVGEYSLRLFRERWKFQTPEQAWETVRERSGQLKADTLIHGDYCLPNIMLEDWHFSGFIDLDSGGVGDRHVDLFWGLWSLEYNLGTGDYGERFLDAYGREDIDESLFSVIAAIEVFG